MHAETFVTNGFLSISSPPLVDDGEKQSEDSTCPSIAHKHRFKTRRDAATIISRRHSFGFSMLCRFSRLPSLVAPLPSHSSQQPAWRVVTRTIPTLKVPLLTIMAVELNELVKNGTGLVPPCSPDAAHSTLATRAPWTTRAPYRMVADDGPSTLASPPSRPAKDWVGSTVL
ncbi:hypothetical protein NW767_008941 [Fusarium falciforme]|nr:hypothetical protein NW767_008941 [Fusarium falciforme]